MFESPVLNKCLKYRKLRCLNVLAEGLTVMDIAISSEQMITIHNYSSFSRISVAATLMTTKDNTEL